MYLDIFCIESSHKLKILTHSDYDTFRFWHILIWTLSDADTFRFGHFHIWTLSESDTFKFRQFQIWTLLDSDSFRFWHFYVSFEIASCHRGREKYQAGKKSALVFEYIDELNHTLSLFCSHSLNVRKNSMLKQSFTCIWLTWNNTVTMEIVQFLEQGELEDLR